MKLSTFASVTSIAGLALAWRSAGEVYGMNIVVANTLDIVALLCFAALAVSYGARAFREPETAKRDFVYPQLGMSFATIGISVLLIGSILDSYSPTLHALARGFGAIFILAAVFGMVFRPATPDAAPSWLMISAGSFVIVLAAGSHDFDWAREIKLLACAAGAISAAAGFLLERGRKEPATALLTAPFTTGFMAYVTVAQRVDIFATLLICFALCLFAIIFLRRMTHFAPIPLQGWVIGFPLAALTNAVLLYAAENKESSLQPLGLMLLLLLTSTLIGLSIGTLFHFKTIDRNSHG